MDAATWNSRYDAAPLVWSAAPNQFVAAQLADLTPGLAVDLGAGEGRNALWLASLGWQVTAVDFADAALAKGRRNEPVSDHPVSWVCADVLTWTPPVPAKLVLVSYLQFAEPERTQLIRRALAMAAPGATFLLVAHDLHNLEHGVGGPQDPALLTDAAGIVDIVSGLPTAAEWQVLVADRVTREVVGADGVPRTAYDTLVRLRRA